MGDILDELDYLSTGKRTRLRRLMYDYGPGHGTLLLLPIDHGLEHGPRDFFSNPAALDPEYHIKLAIEGGYSGIVMHIGLAERYMPAYAGKVPLVLKINGRTSIPPNDNAFSPLDATVEDAVRLGADAVGYTLYVGSPWQDRDIRQFMEVRREAERYGMPVIMWSYPRGSAVDAKGGRNSLYAVEYAARVANELGADLVKLNFPVIEHGKRDLYPDEYRDLDLPPQECIKRVVKAAGKVPVLVSGGSKMGDDDLLAKVRMSLKSGARGLIFGRNMWQRPHDEALAITERIKALLLEHYGE